MRAIHLELAGDLSGEEFLLCLKRFIARRGKPKEFVWDNAPQFKMVKRSTDKIWRHCFDSDEINNYRARQNIGWKFIPEFAPWMGVSTKGWLC